MKMICAILICKIVNFISRTSESIIGGFLALKIDKNILKKIKYPKYIIGIIGSIEKNTTIELISHILNKCNYSILSNKCINKNNITSLIVGNSSLKGILSKDVLIIEFDETTIYELSKDLNLTHLILSNTNDEEIFNIINPECHLIINSDNSLIKKYNLYHKENITYYNINSNGEKSDYFGHNINFKNRIMYINNKKVNFPESSFNSAYSALIAYSFTKSLNLSNEIILNALNEDIIRSRFNIFKLGNRKFQILTNKNENNLSYMQSFDFINKQKDIKTIIFGFNNSSRKYTENDISWIWDIDFELLKNKNINKILLIGKFRYDILVRMIYAGIKKEKIILVDDINNIIEILKTKTKGSIYSIVCLDIETILKGYFENETNENQNCSLVL